MNDIMDMKISGSSAMPGGEYRLVSISGSGKAQGSLRCESLRCSGSARVQRPGMAYPLHVEYMPDVRHYVAGAHSRRF